MMTLVDNSLRRVYGQPQGDVATVDSGPRLFIIADAGFDRDFFRMEFQILKFWFEQRCRKKIIKSWLVPDGLWSGCHFLLSIPQGMKHSEQNRRIPKVWLDKKLPPYLVGNLFSKSRPEMLCEIQLPGLSSFEIPYLGDPPNPDNVVMRPLNWVSCKFANNLQFKSLAVVTRLNLVDRRSDKFAWNHCSASRHNLITLVCGFVLSLLILKVSWLPLR